MCNLPSSLLPHLPLPISPSFLPFHLDFSSSCLSPSLFLLQSSLPPSFNLCFFLLFLSPSYFPLLPPLFFSLFLSCLLKYVQEFISNGGANRSGHDCHWKDSLLLTVPKRRGHSRQGHVGKHQEMHLVRRQKEQEESMHVPEIWLWFLQERQVRQE